MDRVVWQGKRYQLLTIYTDAGKQVALIRQLKPEGHFWGTPICWDLVAPLSELEMPCQPSLS
jgi:hypothetical protein